MKYSETLHDQVESLQVLSDFSARSLCDPEQVRLAGLEFGGGARTVFLLPLSRNGS